MDRAPLLTGICTRLAEALQQALVGHFYHLGWSLTGLEDRSPQGGYLAEMLVQLGFVHQTPSDSGFGCANTPLPKSDCHFDQEITLIPTGSLLHSIDKERKMP